MLGPNKLKRKMASGEAVVLSFLPFNSPALAEVISAECDGVSGLAQSKQIVQPTVGILEEAVSVDGCSGVAHASAFGAKGVERSTHHQPAVALTRENITGEHRPFG